MTQLPPEATGEKFVTALRKTTEKTFPVGLGVPARRFVGELTAHSRLKLGSFAAKRPYQCFSIRGHDLAFQV
jgi:hypothetical protein